MGLRSEYSDGELENWLFNYFKDGTLPNDVSIESNWGLRYYLSPQRHTLLNWFNFKPGSKILEIGAGPGAITESLVKNDVHVTALELSPNRAKINKIRNKRSKNLKVVTGNLEDFNPENTFDYVVCIGVLEYAGLFMHSHQNAPITFINKLRSLLSPEGTLLLAIENRFGLKYWAGSREDHTEGFFDSINDYPAEFGVETFGKHELKTLLTENGFNNLFYYYPYPDYKMPTIIYSDDYLPGVNTNFPLGILPTPVASHRFNIFSEAMAMKNIERNKLFSDFANSFLVIASSSNKNINTIKNPSFIVQSQRLDKFKIQTDIYVNENSKYVVKKSMSLDAQKHVTSFKDSYELLNANLSKLINITPVNIDNHKGIAQFPYVNGQSVEAKLLDAILCDNRENVISLLNRFMELIDKLPSIKTSPSKNKNYSKIFGDKSNKSVNCSKVGLIDLNFDNIIEDQNSTWHLIDYEWCFNFPIPKDYLIGRTLWWFFGQRHNDTLRLLSRKIEMLELAPEIVVPEYVYDAFSDKFRLIQFSLVIEEYFQKYVHNKRPENFKRWYLYAKPKKVFDSPQLLDQFIINQNAIIELQKKLELTNQELSNLKAQHFLIVNSRGFKALEKIRKLKHQVRLK